MNIAAGHSFMKPKAVVQTDYVTCDHGCFLLSFLLYVRRWKSLEASFCRLTSWKVWFPFSRRLLGLDVEGWSRSCPSSSGNSSGSGLGEAARSVGTYSRDEARGCGTGAWSRGSCSGWRGAGESQQKSCVMLPAAAEHCKHHLASSPYSSYPSPLNNF